MNILVGDIGGTKTILSIFSQESEDGKPLAETSFPSAHFKTFDEIVHKFMSGNDLKVQKACFGVAGPVFGNHAQVTYLSWEIDADALKSKYKFSAVGLLNDLESVAYAVPILKAQDVFTLTAGEPVKSGNIAILAPGTGLGEGFLTYENGRYIAHASEGSHASFAPVNDLQLGLWQFLKQKGYKHISFERVCSGGMGVPLLYEYLKSIQKAPEPDWLKEKLAASDDPTPVIFETAHDHERPAALAIATVDLFIEILGSEAGNLALKVLSTGGLYLGGGMSPRILSELQKPAFLEAVCDKGRFQSLLTKMPLHVILNAKAGLLGAAAYGRSALN